MNKIKVLIADNSGFVRLVMSDILNSENDIEVVGTALDGDELLDKTNAHMPDVIIADIEIPKNYNLFAVKRIPSQSMKRVIITGSEKRLSQALQDEVRLLGIRNFIIKPDNLLQPQLREIGVDIIRKVRITAGALTAKNTSFSDLLKKGKLASARCIKNTETNNIRKQEMQVVVIGASTGGPAIIEKILSEFESNYPACFLIAQHIPASFTPVFAERLRKATGLDVMIGEKNMQLLPGRVIIAPGNTNMVVKPLRKKNTSTVIDFCETEDAPNYDTPSIDLLMHTTAKIYKEKVLGVILSGLGKDGTSGARAIINYDGEVIAQDVNSAVASGMAASAIESGLVSKVFPPENIANYIKKHIKYSSLRLKASINY